MNPGIQKKIEELERALANEKKARKEAESFLERKAFELAQANEKLQSYNLNLELEVERRSMELVTSDIKYRTVIDNMSLGLIEVDNDHRVLYTNDSFCEMVGYQREEIIGNFANDLFIPFQYQRRMEQQQERRKTGQAGVYEVELLKKDGDRIWVIISGVPILGNHGETIGSMGIHFDISDLKKLQKELESAKMIAEAAQQAEKQFLANMSHEIRTPLNAIIGMTHLLADTQLSSDQTDFINVLKSSADILQGLITDVLDFSKIESGKFEIQSRPFNLGSIIQSIFKTFELNLIDRSVDLTFDITPPIIQGLKGDDLALQQILFNLVGNAVKFTHQGSIHMKVRQLALEKEYQTLEFSIKDTGIGIAKEDQAQLFQNYRQAKNDTRILYGGTGLGLAIAKQLIDLQGGKIWLESELGAGTTFYFKITYELWKKVSQLENPKVTTAFTPTYPDKKILVVEDNAMNRKYITTLLNKWTYPYDLVVNGAEALHATEQHQYDLILMDLQMPIMNGYDATAQIRGAENGNQNVPIIALTASAIQKDKQKAMELGMSDFLAKPFTPNQLQKVIQDYLENKVNVEPTNEETIKTDLLLMDKEYLMNIYMGDRDYALEMFELFLDYGLHEIEKLSEKIVDKKWEEVKHYAHKVKPSLGMVGFPTLHKHLDALENAALKQDEQAVAKHYGHFIKDFTTVKPQIIVTYQGLKAGDDQLFAD
ncbi:MAG: hypothetical protein Sapg2KO_31670 [Saprospiraceae bacterium]